jgi:hypothetical protein
MANVKITELPIASALNTITDVIPVVNNNITKQITIDKILANGSIAGNLNVTGVLSAANGISIGDPTIGASDLFVSSTGNVGIGTETPNAKFTVVGSISATSATIVFNNLPTSAAGLPTGSLYKDSGFLKIV